MRSSTRSILVLALGTWFACVCSIHAQNATGVANPVVQSLGSLTGDLVFTPVAPCRILDTRASSGVQGAGTGPIAANTTVAIEVADGALASCAVPYPAAKAAVLNFVAVGAAGAGDLRAWPWDQTDPPPPHASVLNYANQVSLAGLNVANGVIVPICNTATATLGNCAKDLFLRPDVGATHIVIDVLGYFAAPVATPLDVMTVSTPFSAAAAASFSVAAPCPAGWSATGGGFDHGSFSIPGVNLLVSKPNAANGWICEGINTASGGTWTGNCYSVCARVPGR